MTQILFISHTNKLGGPAHSLLKIIKYLPAPYKPSVVIPGPGELAEHLTKTGISYFYNSLQLRSLPALIYAVFRGQYRLVYANNFSYRSNVGLFAAKLSHRPFIWHIREMVRSETPVRDWLHQAEAVIAVSRACADLLKNDVSSERLHVIHNGIDLDEFSLDRDKARCYLCNELSIGEDRTIVASLGHICERKNQLEIVEVAARLVQRFPQILFCFFGRLDHSPEYFEKLKQRVAELGLEEHVRWLGFRSDVATLLQGADIYLHTSIIDPHPRSVMEAMGARLPVVAYETDGVPETVVEGQTGLLVPLGYTDGMAAALMDLVANPERRLSMGEQGRKRVEQFFTAERTAREISVLIDNVLAKRAD